MCLWAENFLYQLFFEHFGINLEDNIKFKGILKEHGFDSCIALDNSQIKDGTEFYKMCADFLPYIRIQAQKELSAALKYLSDIGFAGNCAVVDMGTRGQPNLLWKVLSQTECKSLLDIMWDLAVIQHLKCTRISYEL